LHNSKKYTVCICIQQRAALFYKLLAHHVWPFQVLIIALILNYKCVFTCVIVVAVLVSEMCSYFKSATNTPMILTK